MLELSKREKQWSHHYHSPTLSSSLSSPAAMSSPFPSRSAHLLPAGMIISGPPDPKPKPKPTSTSSTPFTLSGELPRLPSRPHSHSGSLRKSSSGPLVPATGLITSAPHSGPDDRALPSPTPVRFRRKGAGYGPAVTAVKVKEGAVVEFGVSTAVVCVAVLGAVVLLTLGVFVLFAVKNMVVLVVAGGVVVVAVGVVGWNWGWKKRGLEGFLRSLPITDLYGAAADQFVKVSGIVTCGSIPLETSYQGIPRCVYVSTDLYEYRGWSGKKANQNHKRLTWGLRHSEKHVADFYISDNRRGLRALVKAGHGAKVVPFVKQSNKLNVNKETKEMHPAFHEWLADCNLSYDDRVMRLEEGFIKEGSTITVIGILQRHENILMIVPPDAPISTGCLWKSFLFSMNVKALVLLGEENPNDEVVTV